MHNWIELGVCYTWRTFFSVKWNRNETQYFRQQLLQCKQLGLEPELTALGVRSSAYVYFEKIGFI